MIRAGHPYGWFRGLVGLNRNCAGTAMVEFAIVLPVLLLFVFGCIEIAVILFLSSSIESAILQASRFGITGGANGGLSRQERVMQIVEKNTFGLLDMDAVDLETRVYASFGDIGTSEQYEDDNSNGSYDPAESFTDINGNGVWDSDLGEAGMGGPSDVVVYRLRYSWGIMTPFIQGVLGREYPYVASIAVRNEPF